MISRESLTRFDPNARPRPSNTGGGGGSIDPGKQRGDDIRHKIAQKIMINLERISESSQSSFSSSEQNSSNDEGSNSDTSEDSSIIRERMRPSRIAEQHRIEMMNVLQELFTNELKGLLNIMESNTN